MQIREDISLKPYNSFGIDVRADFYVELTSEDEILTLIRGQLKDYPDFLIMGGGSNMLFVEDYQGLVIRMANKGIRVIGDKDKHVLLQVSAGEVWDELVNYCVRNNFGGLENLSMIPGSAGAAPIQNIGAYGAELKDHFKALEAVDLSSGEKRKFSLSECEFAYRNSIFKNEMKGQYLILNITLELDKDPGIHTDYGIIKQELKAMNVDKPDIKAIRDAVCNIRSRKLPDPEELGNGGSFFKNPMISNDKYHMLNKDFPAIVSFPQGDTHHKLAAGWLIEQCGWKGYRKGDAGVHQNQALVLVNYGTASGQEILDLSFEIQKSVDEMFGVKLEREINVI